MRSGILSVVALVVVGAGAAGYFLNRNKIDTKDADDKIKGRIEEFIGPVTNVDCPKAERKKGSQFDCKVTLAGGRTESVHIEIFDDDGHFYAKFAKPIINADTVAAGIVKAGKQKNVDAKVDCGKGIVELPPDGLKCSATVGAQTGHILVTEDAKTGEIHWAEAP